MDVLIKTNMLISWPIFLVAALLLHLIASFPHAAAICSELHIVACCFLLDRKTRTSTLRSSTGLQPASSRRTAQCTMKANYTIGQYS